MLLTGTMLYGQANNNLISVTLGSPEIHYSYIDKFGDVVSCHGNTYLETTLPIRFVFNEPNGQFVYITLFPGDKINLTVENKRIILPKNAPGRIKFSKLLNERYQFLMTPFSGINWTSSINYDVISTCCELV